ncbi:MAG: M23 family metallopeptidase [Opitutae bacterium]|nr:M23 family metallopeptidase [Opitutae bacterium]
MRRALLVFSLLVLASAARAQRLEIVWPTPNPAWAQGRGIGSFIQPTVSGDPESGLFGCVRSGGAQFHEGLDLKSVSRDRRGEPTDQIFAAMDGVVRYVNPHPGESNYGRYIVLEHPDSQPAVYTLYAHLSRIEPGLRVGAPVRHGQVIATMGLSAGGSPIPRERAHLHFEIGLVATVNFQAWYLTKRFGTANEHGEWNGMNLMGIDPLDFLREWRARRVDNIRQYFGRLQPAVRVRIATSRVPDFIERYPSLLRKPRPAGFVGGWEIECNATGIPFAWTPLTPAQVAGMRLNVPQIVWADSAVVRAHRCRSLVRPHRGGYLPGSDLETMLQQVFGVR